MSRASTRRGLVIVAVLLVAVVLVMDLARRDSVIVRAWDAVRPEARTPAQERIENLRRSREEARRR